MPLFTFKNPLTISDGTGFTSSFDGEMDGLLPAINELSIGQTVATSSNVTFNETNLDETQTFIIPNNAGTQNMVLGYGFISGSTIAFTNDLVVSENYTHEDDVTILGSVSYEASNFSGSSVTTIHQSGSTTFGNTLDDVHNITGSYSISGSININGVEINEISNNSDFSDGGSTTLVTEAAAYTGVLGDSGPNSVFLRKNFAKSGTMTNSTASFTAVTASVSTLTTTTKNDFQFFLNGMLMEPDALTIEQSGSKFLTHINTTSLGFNLVSGDEVVAWGKFNS
jgi:hypothetical protein